jgi:hypothetical protein
MPQKNLRPDYFAVDWARLGLTRTPARRVTGNVPGRSISRDRLNPAIFSHRTRPRRVSFLLCSRRDTGFCFIILHSTFILLAPPFLARLALRACCSRTTPLAPRRSPDVDLVSLCG